MSTDPLDPAPAPRSEREPAPRADAPYDDRDRGPASDLDRDREAPARRAAADGDERPADLREPAPRDRREPAPPLDPVEEPRAGRTAGAWIALTAGAVGLILLLIFVLQNNVITKFHYLGIDFGLPLGVAMLLAAIAGALVMALVGSVRMIQMGWTIRRLRKSQERILRAAR